MNTKLQKILTLLLFGGILVFASCSNDGVGDEVTPPVEQPAEELETVMMLTSGLGDQEMGTRALAKEGPTANDPYSSKPYGVIMNYMVALFEFDEKEQTLGKTLAYYAEPGNADGSPIWEPDGMDKDDVDGDAADLWGFFVRPLSFKISKDSYVGAVVVANCEGVLNPTADNMKSFTSFQQFVNTKALSLTTTKEIKGYPMSSNVRVMKVMAGKYNGVGYGQSPNDGIGLIQFNKTLELYGKDKYRHDFKEWSDPDIAFCGDGRIFLYRCWSEVALNKISVQTYDSEATEPTFDFQEAFLMNVPAKTNLIDGSTLVFQQITNVNNPLSTQKGYLAWGGELNVPFADYKGSFYSGWSEDNEGGEGGSSANLTSAYVPYRSEVIAEATSYDEFFLRKSDEKENSHVTTNSPIDLASYKIDYNGNLSTESKLINKKYSYLVSPSNFAIRDNLTGKDFDSEKSMILVIKGVFNEKRNGMDSNPSKQASYYPVVINEKGAEVASGGSLTVTSNVLYSVMRNVQYNIDVTVAGPGSDVPYGYLKNAYIIPKITIKSFGMIEQVNALD